jgi:hypothetical protein
MDQLDLYAPFLGKHEDPSQLSARARICHLRGLWQGTQHLSQMLFLLVMEVLHALIRKVDDWSLLRRLGVWCIQLCILIYADDLVLFVQPDHNELQLTKEIFNIFEGASGLGYNLAKCRLSPIKCSKEQRLLAMTAFPC